MPGFLLLLLFNMDSDIKLRSSCLLDSLLNEWAISWAQWFNKFYKKISQALLYTRIPRRQGKGCYKAVKNGNFLALPVFCCSGTRTSQGTCILQGKRNCSGVDHTNNTLLATWVRSLLFKDRSHFSYNHLGSVICRNSHLDKETNPSPLWGPIGGQALCCPWGFHVTARACFPSASNYLVYYCLDILPELVNWKMSGEFYIPKDNNKDVGKVGWKWVLCA